MHVCAKCGEKPPSLRLDATCELRPALNFRAPCLIKEQRRQADELREGATLIPITKPKRKGGRKHVPKGH